MPRSNKELESANSGLKAVIENLQKEVEKFKAEAAEFSLKLIKNTDLQAELERRDAWPEPLTVISFSDEELISEMETRKIGAYAPTETGQAESDVKKKTDTLYHAGNYTCKKRGYNHNGKIYHFGTLFVLKKDTYLSEEPMLWHFKPASGVKDPSLTPFGVKFNRKVPNTSESRYIETFKNNPALKGQGKGMPTLPGN